jgi:hypothetical protein
MPGMTPEEQNLIMRKMLMANSPIVTKKLPAVSGAYGGTTRIKLFNTGLITRLFLDISLPYNASVAPTAIGGKSVFAAIPKVQLLDFDGSVRINTSAYLLELRNAVRNYCNFGGGAFLQSLSGITSTSVGGSNAFTHPQISLATGAQTLRFMLEVPVCADLRNGDLRGMLPAQFVAGEIQVAVDIAALLNNATANDDFVFTAGTMTLGTPSITVYQEYYSPQPINGVVPIPALDTSTVYEVGIYTRTTDNIAAGQEKLVNFPIVREVSGVYIDFINNARLGGASTANDLNFFTVYANGNNVLYQCDGFAQDYFERALLDTDTQQGTNFLNFAAGPISTAIFGNVQLAITPNAAATLTTPSVEVCFESLYAKGAALGGATV